MSLAFGPLKARIESWDHARGEFVIVFGSGQRGRIAFPTGWIDPGSWIASEIAIDVRDGKRLVTVNGCEIVPSFLSIPTDAHDAMR